jgi:serine/threonine-protein kinase
MIGRILDGYRVVALLGRGGMGEVWKAEQLSLGGRPVALKLLRADRPTATAALERLRREGALLARVQHPGVARIYQAGEAEGLYYIALEFVEGETLTQRLAHGPLGMEQARAVVLAVAEALAYAHDQGVLHRDITANNIMLERTGRVVLLDFGLALALEQSRLTSEGIVVGTPQYIAPEVLRSFEPDARSDVYSLGVVLYEALAGVPPFRGERREQVAQAALHETPEPPSRRRPELPARWDEVVQRAMAREPGLRFHSAREFAQALAALATPGPAQPVQSSGTTAGMSVSGFVPAPEPGPRRIAVVPFTDMGGTPEGGAFADGFADAVGVALARHPALRVVPAISTRELASAGLRTVAREFGVEYVLSATVQRLGEQVRLAVALVDARQAAQVYAESLEASRANLHELEAAIVRGVAAALRLPPPPADVAAPVSSPVAHERFLQARGYLQRSDSEAAVDGAVRLLEPLSRGDHADARVWAELARAYRHKFERSRERAWLDKALHAAGHAAAQDPGAPEAVTELARLHVLLGRQGEAEREFADVIARRPEFVGARTGLADLLRREGRLREAEAVSRQAVAMRPDQWVTFNQLGYILFEQGRYDEASEAWQQVVRLTPDNPSAHRNLGGAAFRMGRLADAEQAYRRSLEHQRTGAAFAGLAAVLFARGDMAGSADAAERAVGLDAGVPLLWGNLGLALRWLPLAEGRARAAFDRAVALAREQLAVNPHDVALRADLAVWLACRGDLDEARERIVQALAEDPRNAETLAHAAGIFELRGERAEALRRIEEAIGLGYGWADFEADRDLERLRASEEYVDLKAKLGPERGQGASSTANPERPEDGR